jgi:hypothetical protein
VHFPSAVGRGRRWDLSAGGSSSAKWRFRSGVPSRGGGLGDYSAIKDGGSWPDDVRWATRLYNEIHAKRPAFRVDCEEGYGEVSHCPLIERTSSLQFAAYAAPLGDPDPDIPVVACGLNMSQARTVSAYLLRGEEIYERAGPSELNDAREELTRMEMAAPLPRVCPLRPTTKFACIYDRLSDLER